MTIYYLNEVIAGTPIGDWLSVITQDSVDRDEIAWTLIQIAFSFYHIHGIFMTGALFDVYFKVLQMYDKQIYDLLGDNFFIYLYHYVIGKYGHLNESESFREAIQKAVNKVHENAHYKLELTPKAAHTDVPYPGRIINE